MKKPRILIIGHARHGKDTVAEMLYELFGLTAKSSSMAASEIFLYDTLKEKYGYTTPEECFEDRVNHRDEWHQLIKAYNTPDKARLAKEILSQVDIYTGMRSNEECEACLEQGIFDLVIGVYDPRKPLEPETSFDIDMWAKAHLVLPNNGTLADLKKRVAALRPLLVPAYARESREGLIVFTPSPW